MPGGYRAGEQEAWGLEAVVRAGVLSYVHMEGLHTEEKGDLNCIFTRLTWRLSQKGLEGLL